MTRNVSRKKAMRLAIVSALTLSAGCLGQGTVQAEEMKTYFFDEVVITATRTPVKEFDANANITVITSKEIERNHYANLSEALREVPGVIVNNYSLAGYYGSNGMKINGADEVVVLIDGVKVNSAGAKFSPSMFANLDNIDRIEVLKGSASTLYGSDAKGGVINIITQKIEGNSSKVKLEGGSYNGENYSFMHEERQGDWGWRVIAKKALLGDFKDGRGLTVPAALNADMTGVKITKDFGEKSDLTFTYDAYKADYKFQSLWDSRFKTGTTDNYNGRVIYNTRLDENTTNQFAVGINMYDDLYQLDSGAFYATKVKTMRISDQFTKNLADTHLVTTGFEFAEDKVISFNGIKLTNRALYLQDEWKITGQWKLTGGLRYDNNSGFGSHTTPSINLGYKFSDKTNMYLGRSEYFIPPSPTHLYNTSYGNPNIKPETGHTSEVGINHRLDDTLVASAHIFKRDSKNRIGYVYPRYTNVGDEKADGWDIQLRKQFSSAVSAFVGYTHTNVEATQQRAANVDGYIPKGAWNVGTDYSAGKLDVSLVGKGIIDRPGPQTADAVDDFFPANTYWVWDIGVNYQAGKAVKAFVKINNIFDKFYAEHSNARYYWSSTPAGQWWSAPGRNIRVGMEYTF
ncbi:TonB-dependent receptor plug domain-containing protein [Sporomusa termitida]|uniref:Colicin I receptor n=1 Tax=Sporomusa termitida TaxID=2377 RepID=A0A517DQU5_9FIRM|nr:TonB-dependent receptor [Sporomusa termitida]QDR79734.1 Colicin I receptor [Sporomusa termitida]